MTNFLEIKSKVARCLMVGCAMMMSGVINAYDFDPYSGQTIAIVGKVSPNYYAMRSDQLTSSGISSVASYQVAINEEGEVVFLTSRQKFYRICLKTNDSSSNTQFHPYSGTDALGYSVNTSSYLTTNSNKLALNTSNSLKWAWNTYIGTWTCYIKPETYSFRFRAESLNFYLELKDSEVTTSRPRGKPYLLAEHTWRTLGSSFFGTICFPKAVRAAERAGATFYEIAAKIVDGGEFKGIVLREVTGELTAGTPYIFKLISSRRTMRKRRISWPLCTAMQPQQAAAMVSLEYWEIQKVLDTPYPPGCIFCRTTSCGRRQKVRVAFSKAAHISTPLKSVLR